MRETKPVTVDPPPPARPGRPEPGRDRNHPRHRRGFRRGQPAASARNAPTSRARSSSTCSSSRPRGPATSFGLAAKRLSADTIDFTAGGSSVSKGETFIDTAKNIEAMGIDVVVVRHSVARGAAPAGPAPATAASSTPATAPTSIRRRACSTSSPSASIKGRIEGLTVGLVGDIAHSRVARSNIHGLLKLGAKVIVCGPPTLVPRDDRASWASRWRYRLDDILPRCDVVNVLRIQFERQRSGLFPSIQEYFRLFGMHSERLRRAKPDMLLLAPGPINRGVELTPEVADGPHSAILQQVTNGLAVRMAVLYLLCGQPAGEE